MHLCVAARKNIRELSVDEVKAMLDRREAFILLDVREDHEWAQGHLPRAEHLGRGILERDIELRYPDTATAIVVYCGGGYRSALAAESLQLMGYSNIRSMWGGFRGWLEKDYPVEGQQT